MSDTTEPIDQKRALTSQIVQTVARLDQALARVEARAARARQDLKDGTRFTDASSPLLGQDACDTEKYVVQLVTLLDVAMSTLTLEETLAAYTTSGD